MQDTEHQSPPAGNDANWNGSQPSVWDLVDHAQRLMQDGDTDGALASLEDTTSRFPKSIEGWEARVSALFHVDRTGEALQVLESALHQLGEKPSLLWLQARLCRIEGDDAQYARALDRLIAIDSQNVEAWLEKGQAMLAADDIDAAISCARHVIDADDCQAAGHSFLGDCLLRQGHWGDAYAAFERAAECSATEFDSQSWVERGDQFEEAGQADLALKAYGRAIAENNPQGWHGKGYVLYTLKDHNGAVSAFQSAYQIDPKYIQGYLNAGIVCNETGDHEGALRHLKLATQAVPNDPRPWIRIGEVQSNLGRHEEAKAAFERATALEPDNADAWNGLGNSQFSLGRNAEALQSYDRAIEADPDYAWAHCNRSAVLFRYRRYEEGMQAIDRALEIDPENGIFLTTKLVALNHLDKVSPSEIDAHAEKALSAAGDDSGLLLDVAHFLSDNDRIDRARTIVQRIDASALTSAPLRLSYAECVLKIGDGPTACNLIRDIRAGDLKYDERLVRSFLLLLAERLSNTTALSDTLLLEVVHELEQALDQIQTLSLAWTYKGVRQLVTRSSLLEAEKLALVTLIDVQDAKVRYSDLSYFSDLRAASKSGPAGNKASLA